MLSCGDRADLLDIDRIGDHFVPERGDNVGDQCEPVVSLVGDQNAEMRDSILSPQQRVAEQS